jgi:hypothetical protein
VSRSSAAGRDGVELSRVVRRLQAETAGHGVGIDRQLLQSEKASRGVSIEVVGCRARRRILNRLGGEKFYPSSSSHITSSGFCSAARQFHRSGVDIRNILDIDI